MEGPREKKKSILVSGYYGYHNLGDDAILDMICRDYASDFNLTVLSARPRETAEQYGVKTVNRYRLPQIWRELKKTDLLLCGGGGLLQDKTSTRSLLYYLTILKMAQRACVPSMLYAGGIGPLRFAKNQKRTGRVLRNVDLLSLRETESAALARQLCCGKETLLTADPVFRMEASPDSAADEIIKRNGIGEAPLFAVALRKLGRAELPLMAELLDRTATLSGCTPVFLCMQTPSDAEAAQAVRRLMKEKSFLMEDCRSGADMIAVLRRMNGVVSMRLHTLIFGALAGVPLIGFDTAPKIASLLRTLHAAEPIPLQNMDPNEAAGRITEILDAGFAPDPSEQIALSERLPPAVHSLLFQNESRFALHIISGGDTGGAKMHVLSLLQGLMKHGTRVLLVCFIEGDFASDARAAGIPVRILPQNTIISNVNWLTRYVSRNRVDVVHCHGARANMYGALLRNRTTVPVVTTIHSDPDLDYLGRPAAARTFGRINRLSLRRIDWHICVSEELRNKMAAEGMPEDRLFQIDNGMDFAAYNARLSRKQWYEKHSLPIPDDAVVFGTAARLSPVKDIPTMITAFSQVLKRYPNTRLLIAGEGSEEKKLRALAAQLCPAGTVFFAGWLEDTASFYHAIDVNVLTSLSEGFPYAIPEGGSMRCATIATRVGSIPAVISDGENGLLIGPGDVHKLAQLMETLVDQPKLRLRLGNALYRTVAEKNSLDAMVRIQTEIYDRVCTHDALCVTNQG